MEPDWDDKTLRPTRLQTVGDVDLERDFLRPTTGIRLMGVLIPVRACVVTQFLIDCDSMTIGRDDSADLVIPDDVVSKQHARIYQRNGLFAIEDLGSSNGTYVDNVPVISCALHGGDGIRVGRNLFVFDRIRVFEEKGD